MTGARAPSNLERVEKPGSRVGRDIALYTAARVGLAVLVTLVLLWFDIPLLVSIAIAVVVGFPLGLLIFRGLNERVTAGLAERGAQRTDERDRLRSELRGESAPGGTDDLGRPV